MSIKNHLTLKVTIIILCIISIVSSLSTFPQEDYKKSHGYSWEEYDPSFFLKFQSVNDIITEADSRFSPKQINTVAYYSYVSSIVRKRFYHDYSFYSFAENPLAYCAGKLTYGNLAAIVKADDIMKHPMAACSQQSIVMMEIFKRKGTSYRKMGFDHHYTVEGMIEGEWRYFDTDMEPSFKDKRESYNKLVRDHKLDSVYSNTKISKAELYKILGNPHYGKTNASPAPRAALFQKICLFFTSNYFFIMAFVIMTLSEVSVYMKRLYKNTMILTHCEVRI